MTGSLLAFGNRYNALLSFKASLVARDCSVRFPVSVKSLKWLARKASPLVTSAFGWRSFGLRLTTINPAAREKNLWFPVYFKAEVILHSIDPIKAKWANQHATLPRLAGLDRFAKIVARQLNTTLRSKLFGARSSGELGQEQKRGMKGRGGKLFPLLLSPSPYDLVFRLLSFQLSRNNLTGDAGYANLWNTTISSYRV